MYFYCSAVHNQLVQNTVNVYTIKYDYCYNKEIEFKMNCVLSRFLNYKKMKLKLYSQLHSAHKMEKVWDRKMSVQIKLLEAVDNY